MQPRVHPLIHPLLYQGKNVIIAEIPPLEKFSKPCYYKPIGLHGGSFIRDGEGDVKMSDYEIYSLTGMQFQAQAEYRTFPGLIDGSLIDKTAEDLFLQNILLSNPNLQNLAPEELLLNRGLRREGLPTLLDILLFGKAPQRPLPNILFLVICRVDKATVLRTIQASVSMQRNDARDA